MYNSWRTHQQNITLVISNTNSTRTQEILSDLDRLQHPFTDIIVRGNKEELEQLKMSDQVVKHAQPIQFQERYLYHYLDPHLMDICDVNIENSSNWFMIMDSSHNIRENADVLMANATSRSFVRNKKKRSVWQSIFGTKANHNHWHEIQKFQMQNYWQPIVPFTPAFMEFYKNYDCNVRRGLGMSFHKDWAKVFYEWDVPFHVESRNEFCEEWREMYIDSWEGEFYQRQHNLKVKRLEFFLSTQGIETTKALDFFGPRGPTATEYMAYLTRERKDKIYKMTDLTDSLHAYFTIYKSNE